MALRFSIFSRLLALALLLLALAGLWLAVGAPAQAGFAALADERQRLLDLRTRYRSAAEGVAALGERRDAAKRKSAAHAGLVEADSAAAAAALMQGEIKRAVEAAGGVVRRVVVAPAESGDAAERVGVDVLANLDIRGLYALLGALELENPQLHVGDLQVELERAGRSAREEGRLSVRFDLYAFRRVAEGGGSGDSSGSSGYGGAARGGAPAFRRADDG